MDTKTMRYKDLVMILIVLPLLGAPMCGTPTPPSVEPLCPSSSYLGCSQPWVVVPGPEEGGNYYSRTFWLTPEDRIDFITIDMRNWVELEDNSIRFVRDAALQPFRVWVWLGGDPRKPGAGAAQEYQITPDAWGLLTVPLRSCCTGTITVAVEMIRSPDGAVLPLGTCKSQVLTAGVEWWCRPVSGARDTCYDMATGGDSPQTDPPYVAYPAGIWVWGEGPSLNLQEPIYYPDEGIEPWGSFEEKASCSIEDGVDCVRNGGTAECYIQPTVKTACEPNLWLLKTQDFYIAPKPCSGLCAYPRDSYRVYRGDEKVAWMWANTNTDTILPATMDSDCPMGHEKMSFFQRHSSDLTNQVECEASRQPEPACVNLSEMPYR